MPKRSPNNSNDVSVKAAKFAKEMAKPDIKAPREAAIKAGFSEKTASAAASRLLKDVKIQNRIAERKAEVAKYADITDAQILGATALRAFATIDDVLDVNGRLDIAKARRTGAIHLIKKITRSQTPNGENVAVEFYSNESAQDRLGSYLGLEKQAAENPQTLLVFKATIEKLKSDPRIETVEQFVEQLFAAIPAFQQLQDSVNSGEYVLVRKGDVQQINGVQ